MNENTIWRVSVNQKYIPGAGPSLLGLENSIGPEKSTQVVDVIVKAKDAQEAVVKGDAYIEAMKIENAYVCGVCLENPHIVDCTEV